MEHEVILIVIPVIPIVIPVILIVIGALGIIPKGFLKELEDLEIRRQVEIIQSTVLLRSARILRKVLET